MSNATMDREQISGEEEKEKTNEELIAELKLMKLDHGDTGATPYPKIIREIAEWATGVMNEKRMKFYPTKTDDDFQRVLDALEEDLLSGM